MVGGSEGVDRRRSIGAGGQRVGDRAAHGLSPRQVFGWRRESVRRAQQDGDDTPGSAFAEVRVAGTPAIVDGSDEPVPEVVEPTVGEVTLRIGPSVPGSRVQDLLRAVRSA